MMENRRMIALRLVATTLALASPGCFQSAGASLAPSWHFVYPNSNVTPTRETTGSRTKLCGIIIPWSSPDGDDQQVAVQRAMKKVDADLLINLQSNYATFNAFLFQVCWVTVHGMGAKMEVGRQDIRAPPTAPASTAPAVITPVVAAPTCKRDKDCPGDDLCANGACQHPPPVAQACKRDKDCPGDQVCIGAACQHPPPAMPVAQACKRDKDCPGDQVCNAGKCSAP